VVVEQPIITITETTTYEDSELQRAIQASLMTDNNNNKYNNKKKKNNNIQSSASKTSGRAAASRTTIIATAPVRAKQSLANTHLKVQIPKRLSQHDQKDVIIRCANRVAPYSLAIDTLLRSLKTIQADPSDRKYHTVDTTTAMFQRSLKAPGVLDFLKAVNFHTLN